MSSSVSKSQTRLVVLLLCSLPVFYYILHLHPTLYERRLSEANSSNLESRKQTLKILCFGDSLTAGQRPRETSKPLTFYSYAVRLEKLLRQGIKEHARLSQFSSVVVQNQGKPGELAVGAMKRRLIGLLKGNETFDLVIILGGTNDLAFLKKKPSIAANVTTIIKALLDLHELCHYFNVRTVVVTIPPRRCDIERTCKKTSMARRYINTKLYHYATRTPIRTLFVDLARFFKSSKLFSDFVHFTDKGYDKMADIFFYLIKERF
ncbi:uncharacterized protein LOC110244201 [Exaiptasia diaphana]|uniref:SGNH hydrolase-type esterase domain-containing protein n=1 Tax=Exaiptasia diaphana TaxID=2652724 RepID=A0A913XL65_EXADI|nr:uncharacterized protein LOC110244201 [Exaiptasia diaphana]